MTTARDCTMAAARRHVGVSESPAGSNRQPFSTALGRPPEAWCADFLCYCDAIDCGLDFAWLGLGLFGTPSCRVITDNAKRKGRFGSEPRVGAWVMFGPYGGSHVERVLEVRADGIVSIGGNTSAPNNYAGGTVAQHFRAFGPHDDIYGYVYPPYTDPAQPAEEDDVPYIVKCTDPNHSQAQYAVVSGIVVLIQNVAELQAMLHEGYETKALPAGVFDGVAKRAV